MSLNLFQIVLLIILFSIFYVLYKYKAIFIIRFILGIIITHFCTDFYLRNGIFNINNSSSAKEEVIVYLANDIFFSILFFTSFFVFLLKKQNRKKNYFVIPLIVFILILFVIMYIGHSFDYLLFFGTSLFISFFPLYIYSYYLKFLKKEI